MPSPGQGWPHASCAALLLWVCCAGYTTEVAGIRRVTPTCSSVDEVLDTSTLSCLKCSAADPALEANPNRTSCWCKRGYASANLTSALRCIDCTALGLTSDTLRESCIPCSATDTGGLDTTLRDCSCPSGSALTDRIAGYPLAEKTCLACSLFGATPAPRSASIEELAPPHDTCVVPEVCPEGATTEFQNICLPEQHLREVGVSPGDGVDYGGSRSASPYLGKQAVVAGVRCAAGLRGAGGCELLANLCVLQLYDASQGACRVYYSLLEQICSPPTCLVPPPESLPWLYYQLDDQEVAQVPLKRVVRFGTPLDIAASAFDLQGNFLGVREASSEIFLCEVAEPIAAHGMEFGNNIISECRLNGAWFERGGAGAPPEPVFFELFIRDEGNVSVPLPIRYAGGGADDASVFYNTETSRRSRGGADSTLYRRFALFDNVLSDSYVRYVSKMTLLVALDGATEDTIFTPVVTLEYGVWDREDTSQDAAAEVVLGETPLPEGEPRTTLKGGVRSKVQVYYVTDHSNRTILALMITSCCVAFFTSLVKAWAWQRRLVTPYVDLFGVLVRWFVYYCSHFSTYFFIVTTGASLWYFFWFKGQSASSVLLPPPGHITHYFTALLWTSFACRFVDICYRVHEQCTMWVFLLDWEQPRGKLVNENKEVPVSMWRMVFAANAFNQLQAQLSLKIYATVLLTLVLLEAVGLQGLTTAQPDGNDLSLDGSFSHPLLRVAITIVIWYGVMFSLWLWDVVMYHRFFAAHPVREFVDLLSLVNVSMFMLLERRRGFYVHGKSVHQFCEASVREFQAMLRREEEGAIPLRGLTGQSDKQTFEILIDDHLAAMLFETNMVLQRERAPAINQNRPPRRCYEYVMGMSASPILSQNALRSIQELNRRLMAVVAQVVDEVQTVTPLHRSLGVVPFVHPSMPTRFYQREDDAWTEVIFGHLEFALSNLALLFYLAIDFSFRNAFVAASVAFALICFFQVVRRVFGSTNLARKTMLDERFFL